MNKDAPFPSVNILNTRRNRVSVWLANRALQIASPEYRAFVKNAIVLGLIKASEDAQQSK